MNGFRTKRGRRQSGKSGCQSEGVMGSEQRELSSEDGDASFQEKLLALIDERPVPKTDTGGQGEKPKVSERTVAKELGKIAPYVRKKGRSKEPQ